MAFKICGFKSNSENFMVNPYITQFLANGVISFFFLYAKPMSFTISRDLPAGSVYIGQEWVGSFGMDLLFPPEEDGPRIIEEPSIL